MYFFQQCFLEKNCERLLIMEEVEKHRSLVKIKIQSSLYKTLIKYKVKSSPARLKSDISILF